MKMNLKHLLQQLFCADLLERNKELERYLPSFRFSDTLSVSGDDVRIALEERFPSAHLRIADSTYDVVKWDDLLEWLKNDSLSEIKWCEDIWDCDDFADESACRMHLLGRIQGKNFAYRVAWGETPMGYHAFCLAYVQKNSEKEIRVVEPQNDDTKDWKKSDYKPDYIKF
jgi:hypothetical protein